MIYIIDNQKAYSSHAIYFVETDLPSADVLKLVNGHKDNGYDGPWKVVAYAKQFEMWSGKYKPFHELFDPYDDFEFWGSSEDVEVEANWNRLTPITAQYLYDAWTQAGYSIYGFEAEAVKRGLIVVS